jgi:NADH dehydrogenase FAD-containing subunit
LQAFTPSDLKRRLASTVAFKNDGQTRETVLDIDPPKQAEEVKPNANAVQGATSHTKEECTKYACMAANPDMQKRLERLTKPRPYPLFLMEKGAKIVGDLLPSKQSDASTTTKEKVVVLGTGWGAAAFLSEIDNDRYDVTVISPRNFFLFTPMLAGAGVGTVDVRSITQPIREVCMCVTVNYNTHDSDFLHTHHYMSFVLFVLFPFLFLQFNRQANYLEAAAESIDPIARTVTCNGIQCNEFCEQREFTVPYDRLVVAVGARINTFGIPGVEEFCSFLKQIDDARTIRKKIVNLFEQANYPGQSPEKIKQLLTFAVIGAGPTGVEFVGELRDFVEQDGPKYYPHLLPHVSIKLIEATPIVLRPFTKDLQEAAIASLTRPSKEKEDLVEIILDHPVKEVTEDTVKLGDGREIPYGLAVWAGGIGPLPITLEMIEAVGGKQKEAQKVARGKLAVDPWLRVVDGEGRIFGIGDCVCTQDNCLPATAQVAAQQGEFLAHVLSVGNLTVVKDEGGLMLPPVLDKTLSKPMDGIAQLATGDKDYLAPFQFWDMGILAYTGVSFFVGTLVFFNFRLSVLIYVILSFVCLFLRSVRRDSTHWPRYNLRPRIK